MPRKTFNSCTVLELWILALRMYLLLLRYLQKIETNHLPKSRTYQSLYLNKALATTAAFMALQKILNQPTVGESFSNPTLAQCQQRKIRIKFVNCTKNSVTMGRFFVAFFPPKKNFMWNFQKIYTVLLVYNSFLFTKMKPFFRGIFFPLEKIYKKSAPGLGLSTRQTGMQIRSW